MAIKTMPDLKPANLTFTEMQRALSRIDKRIQECEAFDVSKMQTIDDASRIALEHKLDELLMGIFGHGTVEYVKYQDICEVYKNVVVFGQGDTIPEMRNRTQRGLLRTVEILKAIKENFVEKLEEAGIHGSEVKAKSTISATINQESLEVIDKIKILLTLRATGKTIEPTHEDEYKSNRIKLLKDATLAPHVPSFVRLCSDLNEFWSFIQPKFAHYAERKTFIKSEMDKLITIVDQNKSPLQIHALPTLDKLNSDSVRSLWLKSMSRLVNDPEGAITAAKTLLEDVIKNLLNDLAIDYRDDKDDLPKLYNLVAKALNLSPAQHLDKTFKEILSGNFSIVNGMAGLRNKISDAHASGKRPVKPHKRHAEYVVNLAGSLSTFLVSTWEYNKSIPENALTNTA